MIFRQYQLFTRDRRPGAPVLVIHGAPEEEGAVYARSSGLPVVVVGAPEGEDARAITFDREGREVMLPDLLLAAYRLWVDEGQALSRRLRFHTPAGEFEVQQEVFRPIDMAHVWREVPPPAIHPLPLGELARAMSLGEEALVSAALVLPPSEPPLAVVTLADRQLLRHPVDRVASDWLDGLGLTPEFDARWALACRSPLHPLFDGHVRMVDRDGRALLPQGAAALACVPWLVSDPYKMVWTLEVGDGQTIDGHTIAWIEREGEVPTRLSLGGHVKRGETLALS